MPPAPAAPVAAAVADEPAPPDALGDTLLFPDELEDGFDDDEAAAADAVSVAPLARNPFTCPAR